MNKPTLTICPLYVQLPGETKPDVWIRGKTKIVLDSKTTAHKMDGIPLIKKGAKWVYFPT